MIQITDKQFIAFRCINAKVHSANKLAYIYICVFHINDKQLIQIKIDTTEKPIQFENTIIFKLMSHHIILYCVQPNA